MGSGNKMNTRGNERPRREMRFGWLLVCLVLLAVIAFVIALTLRILFRPVTMPYYGGGFFLFFFPFGILVFFLVVIVIARLIFWPLGLGYRRAYWRLHSEAAEIVKARYARGEITQEQYDQMMRDLEQHP